MRKQRILFLQLPRLENAVGGGAENLRRAAAYLAGALRRSEEGRFYRSVACPSRTDILADRPLVDFIVERENPAIIAATLYVWNVERTLAVLRQVKRRRPSVRVLVGGPEVAPDHPFLFGSDVVDVAVSGEGEGVFPCILGALRTGRPTDFATVAWRTGHGFQWGRGLPAATALADLLPPAEDPCHRPDAAGMAYLETSRGCPLRCSFCCYNQRRRGVSFLAAGDVMRRVRVLMKRGAKEIRFIDPTFNANPEFERILEGLAGLNAGRRVRFFAEVRAETITSRQAALLDRANVREIEVGLQSRSPRVLRAIRRPTNLAALDRGVRRMARRRIRLTLDVMSGLPYQTPADLRASLRWASRVPGAQVQFLHTLLIPGTDLRARRHGLGLWSEAFPPYRVTGTDWMSERDFREADRMAEALAGARMDCPAERFVGWSLPDLFPEQVMGAVSARAAPDVIGGRQNRRALILRGRDLYARRKRVTALMKRAIVNEPHALWQFVLSPETEEPLDLLEAMVETLDSCPGHFLDRMTVTPEGRRRAARRVFVLLRRGGRYSPGWIAAAKDFLESRFY